MKRFSFIFGIAEVIFLALPGLQILLAAASVRAGEAKAAWQEGWEKTVAAAKKEGQVTVYVHSSYSPVLDSGVFQRAYPLIELIAVSGVEGDLERRFLAERRAGKYLADVFMVGVLRSYDFYQAKLLDPIKPALILPEVVDESRWWQGKHHHADPERRSSSDTSVLLNWGRFTTTPSL